MLRQRGRRAYLTPHRGALCYPRIGGGQANLRTVRVFGLAASTTEKQLLKRVQKLGGVVEAVEVAAGVQGVWPQGATAKVTMATPKGAAKAIAGLEGKTLHGQTLCARYEVHVLKGEKQWELRSKVGRVIVRNLHFKATADDLALAFSRTFGPVTETHVPTVTMPAAEPGSEARTQSRGFGFVQFLLAADAAKADQAGRCTVNGRDSTCALAVAKAVYDKTKDAKRPAAADEAGESSSEGGGDESSDAETSSEEEEEEEDEGSDGETEGSSEDSESEGDEVGSEDEDEGAGEDGEEEEGEEGEEGPEVVARAKEGEAEEGGALMAKKGVSRDVAEGRTVFVKNLPLEAGAPQLEHRFAEMGYLKHSGCSIPGGHPRLR